MEAEAIHDFPGNEETELPFKKGDKLILLNYGDDVPWYTARKDKRVGLVPCNYIEIEPPKWFKGKISRGVAEQILYNQLIDGAFLVRMSESAPNDYSLSVKCGNSVQHFRILKSADDEVQKYFLWQAQFNSLNELVNFYRNETVSKNSTICLRDMNTNGEFIVVAKYDFKANPDQDGDAELGFKKGDLITVCDTSDDNWWAGSIGQRSGFFPRLYVTEYVQNSNSHLCSNNLN